MELNMICKWLSVLQVHDNAFRMRETNQKFLDLRKRTEILSSPIVVSMVTTETPPPTCATLAVSSECRAVVGEVLGFAEAL
ncbi:hypothetical protein QTP88_024696 [Uroleucon formosanum]